MKPVEFTQQNTVIGEGQEEDGYEPLPAFIDPHGVVVTCWELTDENIKTLLLTKRIYFGVYTFNKPMQPIFAQVEPPFSGDEILN